MVCGLHWGSVVTYHLALYEVLLWGSLAVMSEAPSLACCEAICPCCKDPLGLSTPLLYSQVRGCFWHWKKSKIQISPFSHSNELPSFLWWGLQSPTECVRAREPTLQLVLPSLIKQTFSPILSVFATFLSSGFSSIKYPK